ncbi:MAG: DUF3025 domain-containing protein [Pseudomonadota bacterium]
MRPLPQWNPVALSQSPLFAPLRPMLARLPLDRFPTLADCNALLAKHHPTLTTLGGQAARFVAQAPGKLPFAEQYEPRCYLKGEIQTRDDNWHDLFNALVWLTFPNSKSRINARHYHALQKKSQAADPGNHTTRSQRGSLRDANTLLDESGVIVVYSDESLAELLREFSWKALFWQQREQVKQKMGFYLFGHGLCEKALAPYIGMTGQGILLPVADDFFAWSLTQRLTHIDERLSDHLSDTENSSNTTQFSPVPLLGIPGWSPDNEAADYYDNTAYFRPKRIKSAVL